MPISHDSFEETSTRSGSKNLILITLERRITPQMHHLREMSYDDFICGQDEFELASSHVTAWKGSEPVGMVRLTPGPPFALVKWSKGCFPQPQGARVLEMTRGVVHPLWRRHGIYKALMFESMIRTESSGTEVAIAAVRPEFTGKLFLQSLGFLDAGELCWFDNYFLAQPIECEMGRKNTWREMYRQHQAKMVGMGVQIVSDLFPTDHSR
jgi:hypothetical protein